jgi:hypothetical protein
MRQLVSMDATYLALLRGVNVGNNVMKTRETCCFDLQGADDPELIYDDQASGADAAPLVRAGGQGVVVR